MHKRHDVRAALLLGLTACGPLDLEGIDASAAGRRDFDAASVLAEFDDSPRSDAGAARIPSVSLTSPASGSRIDGPLVQVEGNANDDRGIASVSVRVGQNQPVQATSSDGFRSFSLSANAPVGDFPVVAIAYDLDGAASAPATVMVTRPSSAPDDAAPIIRVDSPIDGSSPLHPLALVRGSTSDDRAVVSVELSRDGVVQTEREVETSDSFASWSRLVPLVAGASNTLVFTARDAAGHSSSVTLTLVGRATTDRSPPALQVASPQDNVTINQTTLEISGGASDDVGVREVKVRVGKTPQGASAPVFGAYQPTTTTNGYQAFRGSIELPSGALVLQVRAIDLNGLSSTVERRLQNDFVSPWSDEVALPLRLRDDSTPPPLLSFALDRKGIDEVFTEAIQRDIRLLELDTSALLTDAVEQIKNSCGTLWRENDPNPRHDCSATSYGKDRTPPIPWQQTPEFSMVRLLTMTPANVVVTGTSLQNLSTLADNLQIGGGFHAILSDTLGIPATQEIVSTNSVVRGLQTFWMQTHPEVLPGAKLPITLYDGMHELNPLAERFGPRGAHSGLLDPDFPPRAELLTPGFEMRLKATSNLIWFDGVDTTGSKGPAEKDYLSVVSDKIGPSFDDVLEFDFNDPARFDVVGLVARPTVDMRMYLRENPAFVRSCVGANATCLGNLPDAPAAGYVWQNPRFEIESVVAASAYYQYQNRRDYSRTYSLLIIPAAVITVGAAPDPAGWTTYGTLISLGDPPPPQYVWETIGEVGQVALHNNGSTTIAEGAVNVAFSLRGVDVGLTADGIRSAMRPALQQQRQKLSNRLFGDYRRNNGTVDFVYRRGADSLPYLFFVAPSDPLPSDNYNYQTPGFFADEALTTKLSSTAAGSSGDSVHEKLALAAGETTLYMRDDSGQLVRLRFVVPAAPSGASEIQVFVSRKVP